MAVAESSVAQLQGAAVYKPPFSYVGDDARLYLRSLGFGGAQQRTGAPRLISVSETQLQG